MTYLTRQEAFDTALTHLRKQGCKSVTSDTLRCAYRGRNGTKCAIGALIPDEKYERGMDIYMPNCNNTVSERHLKTFNGDPDDLRFYRVMQTQMHDCLSNIDFALDLEYAAAQMATIFSLEYSAPSA